MSELNSYFYYEDTVITPATHRYRVYHADDADKLITELRQKLEAKELELANLKEDALNTNKAREKWLQLARKQAMEICHLKYKRCLKIAKWCFTKANYHFYLARSGEDSKENLRKDALYTKWRKRWLKIAEQFKESK